MGTTRTPAVNYHAAADGFGRRMLDTLNGAASALMLSVGHRTGLFDVLSDGVPRTSQGLADRAGLSERYVREWLGALACAKVVTHDAEQRTYRLPPEHAAFLARAAVPNNIAALAQWVAVLAAAESQVVEAFRHGRGVPYSAYPRFHEVMEDQSAQTTLAGLDEHIVPLVPGLERALEDGIDAADVGCGRGRAVLRLAERYPRSRFTGIDFSAEAVAEARGAAGRTGLRNASFEVHDASIWSRPKSFDWVVTFHAMHDQADPPRALSNIHAALRPGGVYLMQDMAAETDVRDNLDHAMGPFVYTVSCMHCVSVSLACGGAGLGAAWGRQRALSMLADAGFTDVTVRQLPHDTMNFYYVAHKP